MAITSDKKIYDMRVNALLRPMGIPADSPVFSWKISSGEGFTQSAYRITLSDGASVVWDSKKTAGAESVGIKCGVNLAPMTEYHWSVRVWGEDGSEVVSEESGFETGLPCENPFGGAEWISCPEEILSLAEKYTVEFDFVIERGNQGFCFGMEKASDFCMWQVNTETDGRVLLRPHIRKNGNWFAFPGGAHDLPAYDVTAALGLTAEEIIGRKLHEKIEVSGCRVRTYFSLDGNEALVSDFENGEPIPLRSIGFRQYGREVALFGNIAVTAGGNVIYRDSFEDGVIDFTNADECSVDGRMLRVGGSREVICWYEKERNLPVFRREFTVKGKIKSARLYTSGLGVYESYINGRRVGRVTESGVVYDELKPGFTQMSKKKFYSTYDVKPYLSDGANVISSVVSHGWWSDLAAAHYGRNDAYLAKLVITYADGTTDIVDTDESWKCARASRVVYADIFTGETYDARVSDDWNRPDYDDSTWKSAVRNVEFDGTVCPWEGSPITTRADLCRSAQSVVIYKGSIGGDDEQYGKINVLRTPKPEEAFVLEAGEVALIDFGQNFAGREAFSVEGDRGTVITVRHGEMLNDKNGLRSRGNDGPEGSIYNLNYRSAKATTKYTLSGGGIESYHPTLTFYGFRYIEIKSTSRVVVHHTEGQVVTSVDEECGFLETSSPDINRLISNIRWGQYSNYLSIPTDCPQRDERQGWTADTQVFTKAGCYLANAKSFLTKFTGDMRDSQREDGAYPGTAPTGEYGGAGYGGTGWSDAGIIVPYQLYRFYGDKSVIYANWDAMTLYFDGYLAASDKRGPIKIWGDWLAYESNDSEIQEMLGVAFYAWDALMMAEMAEAVGRPDDAERYRGVYLTEKDFFISLYVNADGTLKRGEQSVCLYALFLDLLPSVQSYEAVKNQLISNIEKNGQRLQTGFLGTAILLPTLTKIGRSDTAYTLLMQHENPSWLYSVDQGATTVWERWNSYTLKDGFGDVGMNSFNHYAYGAVAAWMFETMAGFSPAEPGFKKITFAPKPDERLSCKASYDSAYGMIEAESAITDGKWVYTCSAPANTTAEIILPAGEYTVNGKEMSSLTENDDGIYIKENKNGEIVLMAAQGKYEIRRA